MRKTPVAAFGALCLSKNHNRRKGGRLCQESFSSGSCFWRVFLRPSRFHPVRVTPSSLVTVDRNRYSVECRQVGRTVQLRVYADRIAVVANGEVVGEHERQFGRGKTVFYPWRYLPALERKPGALRNGAHFKGWNLPQAIQRTLERLKHRYGDWDRQFVGILSAVPVYGLEAVEEACGQALTMGSTSKEVVLNLVNRNQDQTPAPSIDLQVHLSLKQEPIADCQRYDRLLREARYVAS